MNQINDSQMAASQEVVRNVHERLEELSERQSLEPLKQLFWTDLSYNRENRQLSYRNWSEALQKNLNESPLLFASGGKEMILLLFTFTCKMKNFF